MNHNNKDLASLLPAGLLDSLSEQIVKKVQAEVYSTLARMLTKLPDGRSEERTVEVDGEIEKQLIDLLGSVGGVTTKTVPALDIASLLDRYLASKEKGTTSEGEVRKRQPDTIAAMRQSIEWYIDLCHREGLAYESEHAADKYVQWLQSRKNRNGKPISDRTVNFHLTRVSGFLVWLSKRGAIPKGSASTIKDVKIEDVVGVKRKAIDEDELRALLAKFDPAFDPRCWLPWVLAYSGLRLNEAASLHLDNIQQEKKTGIWWFQIDELHPGQSLKTENSKRAVPVHSHLISMGLLEYVEELREAGMERLFPNWGAKADRPGVAAGYWLRQHMGGHEIHQLRHTFNTTLLRAGVNTPIAQTLMGHIRFEGSETNTYFTDGYALQQLRDATEVLDWR